MNRSPGAGAAQVTVLGSLNVDQIATVERLPRPGETVSATALIRRFGGKGANQAIAAARQGARTELIGCVGDDAEGKAYLSYLALEGIRTSGVATVPAQHTGAALIGVSAAAENSIIVAPGANGSVTGTHVRKQRELISAAAVLLLQWEVPLAALLPGAAIANSAGVQVLFNPSPLRPHFPWRKVKIDILILNEGEAKELFGTCLAKRARSFWVGQLETHGVDRVVITRGARSTWAISREGLFEVPTMPVKPVDTVGAGDAFAGVMAARVAEGADFATAVAAGNCAGALATLRPGAQEAIPSRSATDRALRRLVQCNRDL